MVVVSDAPKSLGLDVEVVVGLPSRNPWTLPFAHKAIFAESVNRYDLFIYSEDDIGTSESNIRAFLHATPQLEPDEIAGFVRYEVDRSGTWFVNEPWNHYHWKPESVKRRGPFTIAEFTNEHAGFYILSQSQLRKAIVSGGFLRSPYRARYDWPETAATDPYTNCGFRKVICISHIESFLVHHMPNPYVHQLDVSLESFKEQIQTLLDIRDGVHPATKLCAVESGLMPRRWQKSYYERPTEELPQMLPKTARKVLSVGCGWGAQEVLLLKQGAEVTAIPLDSVIGAVAEHRGIKVIYGSWRESLELLDEDRFDCILLTNLLHLQRDPDSMICDLARLLRPNGTFILGGPNFDRLPNRIKRAFRLDDHWKLADFDLSGISPCVPRILARALTKAGLHVSEVRWLNHGFEGRFFRSNRVQLGSLTAKDWLLKAERSSPFN